MSWCAKTSREHPGQRLFSTESDFARRSMTQSLQKVAPQHGARVAWRNIWRQRGHLSSALSSQQHSPTAAAAEEAPKEEKKEEPEEESDDDMGFGLFD